MCVSPCHRHIIVIPSYCPMRTYIGDHGSICSMCTAHEYHRSFRPLITSLKETSARSNRVRNINMQRLIVEVEQARKLKNTQTLGTQDPYVKFTLGRIMQKTRVHEDGGKLAVWNQKLIFKYINETKILVQCMNSNTLSDSLIG